MTASGAPFSFPSVLPVFSPKWRASAQGKGLVRDPTTGSMGRASVSDPCQTQTRTYPPSVYRQYPSGGCWCPGPSHAEGSAITTYPYPYCTHPSLVQGGPKQDRVSSHMPDDLGTHYTGSLRPRPLTRHTLTPSIPNTPSTPSTVGNIVGHVTGSICLRPATYDTRVESTVC